MSDPSDEKLDRLLQKAYPAVEVSSDFTLRLWSRLMKKPARPVWALPVPVVSFATALGIVMGIWSWQGRGQGDRWDLFGNAPFDTVGGSYLKLAESVEDGQGG